MLKFSFFLFDGVEVNSVDVDGFLQIFNSLVRFS